MKTYTQEQKIAYALRTMGIQQNIKGYRCLKVAIEAVINQPKLLDGITKELYPYVALEVDTTPARVERAMRHAIESSISLVPTEIFESVFGHTLNPKDKPSNSHYIAAIAEIISEYDEHLILPRGDKE